MFRSPIFAAAALAAGLAAAAPAALAQDAQPAASLDRNDCFQSTNWDGWSSPRPDVIYIKVRNNDYYQIDLLNNRSQLKSGGRFLVLKTRGSSLICSPVDLDLSIADTLGFSTPLFPQRIAKLTDEQVAAMPRSDLP